MLVRILAAFILSCITVTGNAQSLEIARDKHLLSLAINTDKNHLLRSSSQVRKISNDKDLIQYPTFDTPSELIERPISGQVLISIEGKIINKHDEPAGD